MEEKKRNMKINTSIDLPSLQSAELILSLFSSPSALSHSSSKSRALTDWKKTLKTWEQRSLPCRILNSGSWIGLDRHHWQTSKQIRHFFNFWWPQSGWMSCWKKRWIGSAGQTDAVLRRSSLNIKTGITRCGSTLSTSFRRFFTKISDVL